MSEPTTALAPAGAVPPLGPAPPPPLPVAPPLPPLGRFVATGSVIILLFFGGFGAWAGLAPLASSAVAPGTVRAEGSRKTVQHLEGGLIQELLVKEGDLVRRDQVLVRLDRTAALSRFEALRHQYDLLKATEARLMAEQARRPTPTFPQELEDRRGADPQIASLLASQEQVFATRRQSYEGQRDIMAKQALQLRAQIEGLEAQIAAADRQLQLLRQEQATVDDLVKKGLERAPRLLELQRRAAALQGERSESQAQIARARQTIGEIELKALALDDSQAEKVAAELGETRGTLARAEEELAAAADVLRRRELRAPIAGRVMSLKFVTPGGVIGPGTPIMEIVPAEDRLLIEAQINPLDIDVVRPGLPTEIRLTAYKQRRMPVIDGELIQISADRVTDERTGAAHYKGLVAIDPDELARLAEVELYPGMPADVMIKVGERTFFDYLIQPITDSFAKAFHEQ